MENKSRNDYSYALIDVTGDVPDSLSNEIESCGAIKVRVI